MPINMSMMKVISNITGRKSSRAHTAGRCRDVELLNTASADSAKALSWIKLFMPPDNEHQTLSSIPGDEPVSDRFKSAWRTMFRSSCANEGADIASRFSRIPGSRAA